jgi:LacI family transcriptional regulator
VSFFAGNAGSHRPIVFDIAIETLQNLRSQSYLVPHVDQMCAFACSARPFAAGPRHGQSRIAYVAGPAGLRQVADRHEGALRALRRVGVAADDLTIIEADALNVFAGQRAGASIAAMPALSRPTAVFCANDLMALGVLQEMTRNHIRVPDDISIIGYDDIDFAAAAAVPLTSVRQPRQELGRTAARLLLEEAADDDTHRHRQVIFEPELVVRQSTERSHGS